MTMAFKLAINRCPDHPNRYSVSLDDEHGGVRLAGVKCCGRWKELASWTLDQDALRHARESFDEAISRNGDET
jgi:hypothetical protein